MKNILKAAFAASILFITFNVNAQTIPQTQANQQHRIVQGAKSGELTPRETKKLEAEQRGIQAEKRVARADGKVTPRERRRIKHDQRKASRDIYHEKHDAQKR